MGRFNEAPIHESGKCTAQAGIHRRRDEASMRPRFMNRGSVAPVGRVDIVGAASMRPRFMNRGSVADPCRDAHTPVRFNEAPIHESGKCRLYEWRVAFILRFNEAPIHESGKCPRANAGRLRRRHASMRPRFMNRGSISTRDPVTKWNGASMRPRFMNRGSGMREALDLDDSVASMRPRFMNRGSRLAIHAVAVDHAASMRPRFMNRGSCPYSPCMCADRRLQ